MNKLFAVLILFLFPIGNIMSQAPVVSSVSPVKQVINAPRGTSVTVNFNSPVNISTVNSTTFRVFGKLSGPVPGTFEFLNGNTQVKFTPASVFLAGEWVTVNLSKGIKSQDNTPMTKGYNWSILSFAKKNVRLAF